MRLRKRLISLAVAGISAISLSLVPGVPATATFPVTCPTSGQWEVCLNNPATGGTEIIDRVTALTNATGPIDPATGVAYPGSMIRLNTYQFGSVPSSSPEWGLAYALNDAHDRGVNVGVVVDVNHNPTPTLLNYLEGQGISVTWCDDSCIHTGDPAGTFINHSKFMTFKSVKAGGAIDYATTVTSSNFIPAQRASYQNMVITQDYDTWQDFTQYWNQLNGGSWLASWDTPAERNRVLTGATLFALPTTTSPADPVENWIDSIEKCTANTQHRRVRVQMSVFNTGRIAVAQALKRAAAKGCGVQVITSERCDWLSPTYLPAANVRQAVGTASTYKIHDKVVLIDAATNAGGVQKVAYTGSANLAPDSIRGNDDLMLKVTDDGVTDMYFSRFAQIWNTTTAGSCTTNQ